MVLVVAQAYTSDMWYRITYSTCDIDVRSDARNSTCHGASGIRYCVYGTATAGSCSILAAGSIRTHGASGIRYRLAYHVASKLDNKQHTISYPSETLRSYECFVQYRIRISYTTLRVQVDIDIRYSIYGVTFIVKQA